MVKILIPFLGKIHTHYFMILNFERRVVVFCDDFIELYYKKPCSVMLR